MEPTSESFSKSALWLVTSSPCLRWVRLGLQEHMPSHVHVPYFPETPGSVSSFSQSQMPSGIEPREVGSLE